MEPEFMSGEEFLRSIEARLARIEEIANAFHDYQTDNFRRELEDEQLRASIAKTTVCCNKSQNNGSTQDDEIAKLLKIYDPDREKELADVFRYREYSEELETIEEKDYDYDVDDENACDEEFAPNCKYGAEYLDWLRNHVLCKEDFGKRYDDQVESNQKFSVEFETGTEYLQWLELQIPYEEPFQHQDETHYYFFRKWRKDDLQYYSNMECLDEFENEDEEDEIETDASDLFASNLTPIDEETKPEFVSGRQLVEWLGRRLEYIEPFAPNDAVHFYFKRRWSRDKFVATVDTLKEMENEDDEDVLETQVSDLDISELKPTNEETKPDFDSGRQLMEWLRMKLDYLEPFAPNDAVHFYFKRKWSREKFVASVDTLEEVETVEETAEEQVQLVPRTESESIHSSTEDEEYINVYISLMSRPMALDGFKLEEEIEELEQDTPLTVEVNHKDLDKERKMRDEFLAAGPQMEAIEAENKSTKEKKVKKHQKNGRNFLRRLFGL
nr:uncharacterized protein LOC105345161 [Crassostrea gigas]